MRNQVPTTQRRHRYYAYQARFGDGVMWMDRIAHQAMTRMPCKIPLYQCSRYLGQSQLMTADEWKGARLARARQQQKGRG
jgi:hypothetical protein